MTIALDDATAKWARIEAAKHDTSVSRFVGELLRREMVEAASYDRARRSYTGRRAGALSASEAPYPRRDELHER